MKTSDLIVKALEKEGVRYIFGLPGEENLDLLESISNSSITLILTRHEQSAGFMAATYGRLTGEAGVCLATLGPGATNMVTPAAYAQLGAMPMVVLTGQKPIKDSKQGLFQVVDVVGMMHFLTKFSKQIVHGNTADAIIREAFRLACEERPGAVHIEIPEDIAREESSGHIFKKSYYHLPVPDGETVALAADIIMKARSPLIMLGAGTNREHKHKPIRRLIESSGIPFFTTQMGKGVVDERSPLCLGTVVFSSKDSIHEALELSDLVVNIGHDIVEKPPFFMREGGLQVIDVNFSPANIDEVYFPQVEVVGDISESVRLMAPLIKPQPHWDFEAILKVKTYIDEIQSIGADDCCFPLSPPFVVASVREAMPEDGIISLDNGMYKIWFSRNYKAYGPNTILLDNALASMGAGLPAAIATKLVYPDRAVLAVCGDGGFMMNSQELETAVRLGLHIVVLVLNDGAYGMIKWKQKNMGFRDFGLDFTNPDFVKYAESYGAHGHRVTKGEDLPELLLTCLMDKGVHLIDAPIDYEKNNQLLHSRL